MVLIVGAMRISKPAGSFTGHLVRGGAAALLPQKYKQKCLQRLLIKRCKL